MNGPLRSDRRRFLERSLLVGGFALLGGRVPAADGLTLTPPQTEGPFYPETPPLETDNDLVVFRSDRVTAQGVITNVTGRVLDERGRTLPGTAVEIWQCDVNGRYHHPADRRDTPLDEGFQGYGRTVADAGGRYRFRTIRPVPYPGRTPHIHFKLAGPGFGGLTTQMYVAGEKRNARDGVLNRIADERQRAAVIVEFVPDTIGGAELEARFDIVLAADGRFDAPA